MFYEVYVIQVASLDLSTAREYNKYISCSSKLTALALQAFANMISGACAIKLRFFFC